MARRPKKSGLTAKSYQHFAVAIVVVAATLAILSDDDISPARQATAQTVTQPLTPSANNKLLRRSDKPLSSYANEKFWANSEESSNFVFGEPTSLKQDYSAEQADFPVSPTEPSLAESVALGMDGAKFSALPSDQRALILSQLRASETSVNTNERSRQVDRLIGASRSRSGDNPDVDY